MVEICYIVCAGQAAGSKFFATIRKVQNELGAWLASRIPRSHGRLAVRPRKHAAFASPHAFGVRLRATHSPQEMAESMPPKTRRRSTMTKSAASAPEDKLKLYE